MRIIFSLLLALVLPSLSWGMEHYTRPLQDQNGRAISGATVTVYNAGTGTLATIYSDNGTTVKANPFTTGVDGIYDFYAANGRYSVTFAKAGYYFDQAKTAGLTLYDSADYSNPGDVGTDPLWDAKGDLAAGTGQNTASRLPIGTNGYVLTADSSESTGMKWAAPGVASIVWTTQAVTSNTTLSGTHKYVTCDATGGNVTITLPAASAVIGADFSFKRLDGSANTCTVIRAGADTIEGGTSAALIVQNHAFLLVASSSTTWRVQ